MRSALISFTFLGLVFLLSGASAEPADKSGKIQGESHVNLRSGPDLGHPLIAVQEVTVEGEEGRRVEWKTPKAEPQPLIEALGGRGWEIFWWLGLAVCVFFLGWICGGNYYLRRDRIKRTKLRF